MTAHSDANEGWRSLEAILRSSDTKRVKLWLGGCLCRVAVVAPAQGAENRLEAEAAALAALVATKKAVAGERAVYASRYQGAEPAPVAIGHSTVQAKLGTLKTLGIEVVACRPWWSEIDVDRMAKTAAAAPGERRDLIVFYDGEAASVFWSQQNGYVDEASTASPVLAVDEARRLVRRTAAARSLEKALLVHLSDAAQDDPSDVHAADFAFSNYLAFDEAI